MDDIKPEEKSPLLLYVVEGEENVTKNNKRVNFEKGRLYGISSGATAVFTEFPNYISPCWITALISSLIFFMMVLLMVSSLESPANIRVPRCTHSHEEDLDNKTIHLVHDLSNWNEEQLNILQMIRDQYHGFNVHLVLLRPGEDKKKNIQNIQKIPPPSYIRKNISPTTMQINDTTPTVNKAIIEIKRAKRGKRGIRLLDKGLNKRKKRDHGGNNEPVNFGMGIKSLLDILLQSRLDGGGSKRMTHNDSLAQFIALNFTELFPTTTEPTPKTLDDIISEFPRLTVENVTYNEAFLRTPLEKTWFKLNKDLTIFAVRVISLWQYAGLSFKIDGVGAEKILDNVDNFSVAPVITLRSFDEDTTESSRSPKNNKLLNFINSGKLIFDTLPKEVVTADDEGLHIFTKTPCHVFFGEVLMNLRHARGDETPKSIIQKSLKVFCKHSAVGQNYCKNLIRKRG